MVLDAWERFSHYPVIAPLLKTAEPLSNTGLQVRLHNLAVGQVVRSDVMFSLVL